MLSRQMLPDVVVVGGGIVGLATAYFLTRNGARVLVIEREAIACGASGAAAGILSPTMEAGTPPALARLAGRGLELHRTLAATLIAETGVDVRFAPLDLLQPAFDDAEAEALHNEIRHQPPSATRRWLDGAAARALEPRLSPRVTAALHTPNEAQVDSYRLTLALAQAAERQGATIRLAPVTGFVRHGHRVQGVRVAGDTIPCERVVLAAGPWSGRMAASIGSPLPVTPLRGQILHLQLPEPQLRVGITYGGNYVLPKWDFTLAGTTEENVGFRARPTRTGQAAIQSAVLRLAPSLGEARLLKQTACLRPLSADRLPILGALPGWEGLFVASGHGRRGVLLGPVSGQLLAECVMGRLSDDSREALAILDPGREYTGDLTGETSRRAPGTSVEIAAM